jgi:hypothetical protein
MSLWNVGQKCCYLPLSEQLTLYTDTPLVFRGAGSLVDVYLVYSRRQQSNATHTASFLP